VIDANRLRVGEDFTFNGSLESDGSFFIYGGGGTDTLTGGDNNDVFIFGGQNQWGSTDVVTGGAGVDQLALRGNYTIVFGAGQLVGIEQIGMVSAQDTRYGPLGSTYSYNLTMNDANVDSIQFTVDAAPLHSNETLTFNGSAEDDGSFRVFGGRGDDHITGSQNGDILAGNAGSDQLTGGGGADVFRYVASGDSTVAAPDQILDFLSGTDKIDLSRIDADTNVAGDQAFHVVGPGFTGAGPSSAGELLVYGQSGTWHVDGDTDGDGHADFSITLILAAPLPPTNSDFIL
jgi:Ca2+-binding RTX toxin-like protein